MTARELVLRDRAAAVKALKAVHGYSLDGAEAFAAYLFPLPTRTVPTVRQGPSGQWFRVVSFAPDLAQGVTVYRFSTMANARNGHLHLGINWCPEDQPTVAALLLLPLTEEVEDDGEATP